MAEQRYLIMKDGVVDNVAIFDSEPDSEVFPDWIPCPDGVGIGWTDNGDGTFAAPQEQPE